MRVSIREILSLKPVRPKTLEVKCSLKDKSFIQRKLLKRVETTNSLIAINTYRNIENKIVNLNYITILTGFCCGAVLTKKKKKILKVHFYKKELYKSRK